MRINLGAFASAVRNILADTFNRTDSASVIGNATDGSIWTILRGTWGISTNKASSSTAASSYPLATVDMPFTDIQTDIVSTAQGSAAALWVTDANNWWAVGITQEPENCSCTYFFTTNYFYFTSNNCVGQNAGTWNASNCNAFGLPSCFPSGWTFTCVGSYNESNCNNFAFNTKNKTTRCSGSYNSSNCNSFSLYCPSNGSYGGSTCTGGYNTSTQNAGTYFFFSCTELGSTTSGPFESCSTCYPQYIRILQSVAGTVSLITQQSMGATLAAAFRVKTSGNQITASAYSDSAAVTQIGSNLVHTATGATITAQNGIMIIPSTYNQGSTIDSVEIKKN
jgi:hypothetical protein